MKKVIIVGMFCLLLLCVTTSSYASVVNSIKQPTLDKDLAGIISGVVGTVQLVGTFVAVGASIFLGIRYVMSSVDEKATIKKQLIPFVIGVVLFYGATGIVQLIAEMASWV